MTLYNMIKINNEGKIEIYNVRPIYQNDEIRFFSTAITIKEVGEIYQKLTYDGEAQRGYEHNKNGISTPMIDNKHVKNIKKTIMDGENIQGHLTWNIRIFDNLDDLDVEYYTYIPNKNCLVINSNTITLPDSAHRHKALYELSQENQNIDEELLNNEFCLDIYNMNLDQEKVFFTDINSKGKPVPRNRTLFLSNDIRSCLLREVVSESLLHNKVECEKERALPDKLTKFATIYDSLFGTHGTYKNIKIDEDNYDKMKKWLIKFYNELLSNRKEFMFINSNEKQNIKKLSMLLEEIAWWGYAYIMKHLEGDKHWKRSLCNKLNKQINIQGMTPVDFWSKSNPIWDCVRVYNLNRETGAIELGTSVYNSNATRKRVQSIVALNLFS